MAVLKSHYQIILVPARMSWDTECTGKLPDPLYLCDGDAVDPVL